MYVIKQKTEYPKYPPYPFVNVAYFQAVELGFANYTSNIEKARRFRTKKEAADFIKSHIRKRSCDTIEIIKVEQEEQK